MVFSQGFSATGLTLSLLGEKRSWKPFNPYDQLWISHCLSVPIPELFTLSPSDWKFQHHWIIFFWYVLNYTKPAAWSLTLLWFFYGITLVLVKMYERIESGNQFCSIIVKGLDQFLVSSMSPISNLVVVHNIYKSLVEPLSQWVGVDLWPWLLRNSKHEHWEGVELNSSNNGRVGFVTRHPEQWDDDQALTKRVDSLQELLYVWNG